MFTCESKGCKNDAEWYYNPINGTPGYFCTLHTAGKNPRCLSEALKS